MGGDEIGHQRSLRIFNYDTFFSKKCRVFEFSSDTLRYYDRKHVIG
jgi:hypothetical protein